MPAAPFVDGCLRADVPRERKLPHASLSVLLALYGQLYDHNLRTDPNMTAGEFEPDVAAIAVITGREPEKIALTVRLLRRVWFFRKKGDALRARDPATKDWPPMPFGMLPVRYAIARLAELRRAAATKHVRLGDALALYFLFVAQRNHRTEEVWFSREKSSVKAGLDEATALKCLAALLASGFVARASLANYKYTLPGFEATDTG